MRDNVRVAQDALIDAHIHELDPAYQWLRSITDPEIRSHAAAVVDIALTGKLALPAPTLPGDSIRWLRLALERAEDRRCRRALLNNLGGWLAQVSPSSRLAFLEGLPLLAPAAADLAASGMEDVIHAVNRDARLMPCIYAFASTTREIIQSIARLAVGAAVADMQRLVDLFPFNRVEEDREVERLLGVLGSVPQALPLLLALAAHNVSSAHGTALQLKGKQLGQEYLALFQKVVAATGTQSIQWCVRKLPELVKTHAAEAVVAATVAIASQYGALAAQAFLEGQTQAARSVHR